MPDSSYDCVVIGSGPGGYVAAIRAAQLGMKTAVVEKDRVGGRCLNYACIPAKAVLRVADVLSEVREAGDFGIKVDEPTVDFAAVGKRREKVVSTLTGGVSGLFKKNGIELIEGEASLTGKGAVVGRRAGDRRQDDRARHRLGQAADPGRRVRRPGDRDRGGLGAVGAPRQHGGRGRRRIGGGDRLRVRAARHRGAAVRGTRSGAADRGRQTSRRSSSAGSSARESRSTPRRSWRTLRRRTRASRSGTARTPVRCSGS